MKIKTDKEIEGSAFSGHMKVILELIKKFKPTLLG